MPMKPDQELENALMDFLMDGESSIADASITLRKSPTILMRVAGRLQMRGLVSSRMAMSLYGRPELRWFMAKTRKAA